MEESTMSMVIFHSHVSHYQRVNPIKSHKTSIFLWCSYGFDTLMFHISSRFQGMNRIAAGAAQCKVRGDRGPIRGFGRSVAPAVGSNGNETLVA